MVLRLHPSRTNLSHNSLRTGDVVNELAMRTDELQKAQLLKVPNEQRQAADTNRKSSVDKIISFWFGLRRQSLQRLIKKH